MKGIRGENKRKWNKKNKKTFLTQFSSRIVTIIKMELCMKNLTLNMLSFLSLSLCSFPFLLLFKGTKGSKTFLMEFHTRLNLEIRLNGIFCVRNGNEKFI